MIPISTATFLGQGIFLTRWRNKDALLEQELCVQAFESGLSWHLPISSPSSLRPRGVLLCQFWGKTKFPPKCCFSLIPKYFSSVMLLLVPIFCWFSGFLSWLCKFLLPLLQQGRHMCRGIKHCHSQNRKMGKGEFSYHSNSTSPTSSWQTQAARWPALSCWRQKIHSPKMNVKASAPVRNDVDADGDLC